MPFYEKDNVRIRYEEAGTGFPLLIIAGGGLNSTISYFTEGKAPFNAIEEFKGEYRCVASDLRNANGGESSGPLETNRPWDSYTDDQLGLMDHLGIKRFLVLGFCFVYLIVSAVSLRLSAERARKRALAALRGTLIRLQGVAQDDAPPVKHLVDQCRSLIEQTEKLHRGAFSPFTQQPLVRGILALAGGISGAALFEYASAANF